jgi:phage replication protein O, N-terminal domain
MASPQIENGYTKIANELLEAITKTKLSSLQLRILLLILRYTYGFGRKEADLSLSFISEALEAKPNNISRELSFLKSIGIVYVEPARGVKPQKISINKNYESWGLGLSKLSIIEIDNIIKNDNDRVIKTDNDSIIKIDNQERKHKKTIKKYIYALFLKSSGRCTLERKART